MKMASYKMWVTALKGECQEMNYNGAEGVGPVGDTAP